MSAASAGPDFAVVGAGPAGLAAAALAAELGLDTVLYDEQSTLGGRIYHAVERNAEAASDLFGADYRRGADLVRAFRRSGAVHAPDTAVWSAAAGGALGVLRDGAARIVAARRVLIAVGARERPVPIPGWTLPGVMALGAAQMLLKASRLRPRSPPVIAGSGPLVFLVAHQLMRANVAPRAVLLTAPPGNRARALRHLAGAALSAGELWKGYRWMRALAAGGVPLIAGVRDLRALGEDRVAAVAYTDRAGRARRIETGLLLLHEGVVPDDRLARAAGCAQTWDEAGLCWRVTADAWGATDVEGIAVAGDCAGIGGARAAEHRGRLAALDAAYRLGAIDRAARDERARAERAALRRCLRPRPFLDALFRPAEAVLAPPDDETVVCRCEEVSAGEIRRAAALGCAGPNQVKAFTRCGMGPCQGALCEATVAALVARARGVPVASVGRFTARPPVKPITLGEIAGLDIMPAGR